MLQDAVRILKEYDRIIIIQFTILPRSRKNLLEILYILTTS